MNIKSLILLAIATFSCQAFASNSKAPKQAQVPFVNQAVNSTDYEGLTFSYNMKREPLQKVVCTFSYFYKGWMDYVDNGAMNESGTYGGSQTVILTSKGQTGYITEQLDQFHADAEGHATIHHIENSNKSPAFVSCFYMPEEERIK